MKKAILITSKKDISIVQSSIEQYMRNYLISSTYFYNKDYYDDLSYFIYENKIKFSIPEYLAFNFYFFSKNLHKDSLLFLNEFIKGEKKYANVIYLNQHIYQARKLLSYLFKNDNNIDFDNEIDASTKISLYKIIDINNLYYSYNNDDFEKLFLDKILNFYYTHNGLIQEDELLLSQFNYLKTNPKIYMSQKYNLIFEQFAQKNINTFISKHYIPKYLINDVSETIQ